MIWAHNDNPAYEVFDSFGPSRRAVFLPAIVISAGYALLLLTLFVGSATDSAWFRLALVVLLVGAPVMFVSALLRYYTVRLTTMAQAVYVHRGFPRGDVLEIPYLAIDQVEVKKGLGGYITGAGTVIVTLYSGEVIAISDLAEAETALIAIESVRAGLPGLELPETAAQSYRTATGY